MGLGSSRLNFQINKLKLFNLNYKNIHLFVCLSKLIRFSSSSLHVILAIFRKNCLFGLGWENVAFLSKNQFANKDWYQVDEKIGQSIKRQPHKKNGSANVILEQIKLKNQLHTLFFVYCLTLAVIFQKFYPLKKRKKHVYCFHSWTLVR